MFALWPFNSGHSLMILVSGSIGDSRRTLEAARPAVCGHHVLLGSPSGQTHSLTYTHTNTAAPPGSSDPRTCDPADMGPGYPADLTDLSPGCWTLLLRPPRTEQPQLCFSFFPDQHPEKLRVRVWDLPLEEGGHLHVLYCLWGGMLYKLM